MRSRGWEGGRGAEECEVGPSVCSQFTHVLPASIHPRQVRKGGGGTYWSF